MAEENKQAEVVNLQVASVGKSGRKGRSRPRLSETDRELQKTMKRLGLATKNLGSSSGEMLKAAALQIVANRLEEVAALLRSVGFSPGQLRTSSNGASKPAGKVFTLEEIDKLDAAHNEPSATGEVCQICGRPAVYKTKRGMTLCISHRPQGIADDRTEAKVKQLMQKGFGQPIPREEELIMVPQDTIQRALAEQNAEGGGE